MTHYNALHALKQGLEKEGRLDREAAIDGISGLSIESPTGKMAIGADHHATLNMYLAKTEGDGLVTVEALGSLSPKAGCA
jgi:branched-chain amino acid transport system substrate-binding protein/urea transport system substrate-binding protein